MIQSERNLILIFIFFERGRTINFEIKFLTKNYLLQGSPPSLVGSSSNPAATGKIFVQMVEPIPHLPFQSNQIYISLSAVFIPAKIILRDKNTIKMEKVHQIF